MKRIVWFVLIVMVGAAADVQAQSNRKTGKAVQQKTAKATKTKAATAATRDTLTTVSMMSTTTHQANRDAGNRFSIADPVINIYQQRANGIPATFNGKEVIGMPGSTYGIANGRILLRNTTATTPGTNYGSGAVGTGTTLLGVGASENAITVNGKNPYAGPWLWGGKLPSVNLAPYVRDSTRRDQ
ncbi:MAG: hypothetical protein M3Q06_07470 [Bacteroidota bacterium]|nr:hypothetical protein [Bacteroidota bacterium]